MSDQNQSHDVDRALDAWTPMEPPPDFIDRVLSARPLAEPVRKRKAWWLAAPALAVAMIAIVLFFSTQQAKKDSATNSAAGNSSVAAEYTTQVPDSKATMNGAGSAAVAMNQPVSDAGVGLQPSPAEDPPPIEMAIRAGDSVTIHAASPQTSVQVTFVGSCASDTTVTAVRMGKTVTARGKTRATLELVAGLWTYKTECDASSSVKTEGEIDIFADDASRELETPLVREDIDANGREWRIWYQARVPDVRVKVAAKTRVVTVTSKKSGAAFDVPARGGVATIPSKQLAEGEYTLVEDTEMDQTTLIIEFDVTAPRVHIETIAAAPSGGSGLVVSGAVAPGWSLSIRGAKVPVDARRRFEARTNGFGSVIIRAEHPQHGVRYYITLPVTK